MTNKVNFTTSITWQQGGHLFCYWIGIMEPKKKKKKNQNIVLVQKKKVSMHPKL